MEKEKLSLSNKNDFESRFTKEYKQSILWALSQEEVLNVIKNKTISVDMSINKVLQSWDKKTEMLLTTVSWLPKGINIRNPDVLVQFCRIHWFFPIVRNIYLEWLDITKIKDLPQIMNLFFWMIKKWNINFAVYSEISKIVDLLDENWIDWYDVADFYYILWVFDNIRHAWFSDIPTSFWNSLQKNRNTWTFSENIFCEVAFRLENELRNALGIYSTYLNLASMRDDTENKTDMWFTLNSWNSNKSYYKHLPVQFTTSYFGARNWYSWNMSPWANKKLMWIEKKLFQEQVNGKANLPFVVLSVNWEFSKKIANSEYLDSYQNWISNKDSRESQSLWKFPFFINTLDQESLIAPKVAYVMLNLLFSKLKFKKSFKWKRDVLSYKDEMNSFLNEILESSKWIKIGWIYLDKIWAKVDSIYKIKSPNPKQNFYLSCYTVSFSYKWKFLWNFKIYV